jgi:hypothetical protein
MRPGRYYLPTCDGRPARWMDDMLYPVDILDKPAFAYQKQSGAESACNRSRSNVRRKGLEFCAFEVTEIVLGGE